MGKSRLGEERMVAMLGEQERVAAEAEAEVCRRLGISDTRVCGWKARCGGLRSLPPGPGRGAALTCRAILRWQGVEGARHRLGPASRRERRPRRELRRAAAPRAPGAGSAPGVV